MNEVLDFWYQELSPKDWWKKDPALDQLICQRFGKLHHQATQAELWQWRETAHGRLAEIIILDQFSRNIYRDSPRAFAYDGIALILTQSAIACGADREIEPDKRAFMYLPLMHSESKIIHEQALKVFDQPGLEDNYEFELKHKLIIDRFGRYPHRNSTLGRESTIDELEFLKQKDSGF